MAGRLIIGTVATPTEQSNFWGAVNLQNDFDVIQIDKLTNAGERYFFKMLMTADTNTASVRRLSCWTPVRAIPSRHPERPSP